jgi:hypothetical protein
MSDLNLFIPITKVDAQQRLVTNAYNLTTLYRGLYGSAPASHVSGAPFARLDNAIYKLDLPANYIGQTIYLKFQSFNSLGQQVQDLSTCVVYTFTAGGSSVSNPIIAQLRGGLPVDLGLVTASPSVAGDMGATTSAAFDGVDLGAA